MTEEVIEPVLPEPIEEASGVAGQDDLMRVHGTLARAMRARLKTGLASAAEWNSIRAFLADNSITSASGAGQATRELQEELARKRKARQERGNGISAAALTAAADAADRNLQ